MHIIIRESHKAVSLEAARVVASLIRRKPGAVIGLATGRTPITLQLYRNVIIILDNEAASLLTRDTDQSLTPPI